MHIEVFHGADTFRSRAAYLAARAEAEHAAGGVITVLRDEHLTPAALDTAVRGQALFGDAPPVAAERLTALTGEAGAAVARVLRAAPGERALLVWEDGVPAANGIVWRALQDVADRCERFDPLAEREVLTWMSERLAASRQTIEPEAARLLLAACGTNLWALSAELAKLALARTTGPITAADVQALTPGVPSADLFTTVRALASGDGRTALRLLVSYRLAGEDPRRLFFLVVSELRNLLRIRDGLDHGERLTAWALARELRLPHAVATQLLATARRTPAATLRALFDRCVVAYYHMNTGRADALEILESLALSRLPAGESAAPAR